MKLSSLLGMSRLDPVKHSGKYLLWSTAPLNVEDPLDVDEVAGGRQGIEELFSEVVEKLASSDHPQIVLHIHGFNNPKKVSYKAFLESADFIKRRFELPEGSGTPGSFVYVGYQWPSEKLFCTAATFFSSMPRVLIALMALMLPIAGLFSLASVLARSSPLWGGSLAFACLIAAILLVSLPVSLFMLRALVYFRDSYRANNHGVPDLVEFIRRLEIALCDRDYDVEIRQRRKKRIQLNVIGHSMGTMVTTNMVRILADAFKPSGVGDNPDSSKMADRDKDPGSDLGETLELSRLILVSPDMPAEMILTRRANFLQSSLRRFKEAYLFTNEGDVVVRYIAGLANYFSLPTRTRERSCRLANVWIDSSEFGIVNRDQFDYRGRTPSTDEFLGMLRVGDLTLLDLDLRKEAEELPGKTFATKFTYFDFTDYEEQGHGLLTYARRVRTLSPADKAKLLFFYLLGMPQRWHRDVHSGYFDVRSETARTLIFGLACLGLEGLLKDLDPEPGNRFAALSVACEARGVQVLLSPMIDPEVLRDNLGISQPIRG